MSECFVQHVLSKCKEPCYHSIRQKDRVLLHFDKTFFSITLNFYLILLLLFITMVNNANKNSAIPPTRRRVSSVPVSDFTIAESYTAISTPAITMDVIQIIKTVLIKFKLFVISNVIIKTRKVTRLNNVLILLKL
jgi:hypothetical protein